MEKSGLSAHPRFLTRGSRFSFAAPAPAGTSRRPCADL